MEYLVEYKSFKLENPKQHIDKIIIVNALSFWHAERVANTKIRLSEKQQFEITNITDYKPTKVF